jgi:hypothetical protein
MPRFFRLLSMTESNLGPRPHKRSALRVWQAAKAAAEAAAAAPTPAPVAKPAPAAKKKKAGRTIGLGPIKLGTRQPKP